MLAVVAEMRPAGAKHQRLVHAGSLEIAELLRALVEREELVVIGGAVAVARGRLVVQDAHTRLRQPDHLANDRRPRDFLVQ